MEFTDGMGTPGKPDGGNRLARAPGCGGEDSGASLERFVRRWIRSECRSRWLHCLVAAPEKARRHVMYFWRDRVISRTERLDGQRAHPEYLQSSLGDRVGWSFDFDPPAPPHCASAAEAALEARGTSRDSIWVSMDGSVAIVFVHDEHPWLCT